MTIIIGVHIGPLLPIGSIITSEQHHARTYKIAHRYYSEVYRELTGEDFPYEFGYAYRYPLLKKFGDRVANLVKAPTDAVIRGCTTNSIYHSLESHSIRGTVAERLAHRDAYFRDCARRYFTEIEDEELISPSWTVIGRVKIEERDER